MDRSRVEEARRGFPGRGGDVAARARVTRLLWAPDGARRVPSQRALDAALSALPRGELEWLCEFTPLGPLYLLPTPPFLRALARQIEALGARRVVEVAAGDGHLTRSLRALRPRFRVVATDSRAWSRPEARMSRAERRTVTAAGIRMPPDVRPLEALDAVRALRPELVLASWVPPGPLLSRLIRSDLRYVLEIGAGSGVTGDLRCWRYEHEFLDGLDRLARCRLDERPREALHTRATLYFGRAHPDFRVTAASRGRW